MPDGRVTLREASLLLGVSEGAIRKRVARGTIRSEMGDDGLRYVWVDAGTDGGEDASYTPGPEERRGELVAVLKDEIAHLRRESERKDTIILSLSQSNAEMSRTIRALEAPDTGGEPSQDAETVEEGPEPRSDTGGVQEAARRPWWRRMFGG